MSLKALQKGQGHIILQKKGYGSAQIILKDKIPPKISL